MNKIPTLYSDYRECILDLEIYGKIVSTPQQSIQELTDTLFEEFKRRKPLPTLEYKRYELSRLVNPDFRIAYNRELELQENESLVDLDNVISNIEPIDFEDLTPLVAEVQELFSYENNVTDSVRDEIISKYDLNTGEMFKPGIAETENIVGSVQEDESLILSDEEIKNIGVAESEDSIEEPDSDSTDDDYYDDSYDNYFGDTEDDTSEGEDDSDSLDDYSDEDDSDDYSDEDDSDDYLDEDDSDDYLDYDNYETTGEDASDNSDDYSDESDIDSSDDYSDEDDSDDYSDYDSYENTDEGDSDSSDDYDEDDTDNSDDYDGDDYSDYDSYETAGEDDSDSLNDEGEHEFVDSVLDEPTFEDSEEIIKPVEVATPVTPAQIHNDIVEPEIIDRSAEPTDIRAFLRKHPRCEMSFALKYFTKKQISDAIKVGKVIKKGNILKI